MRIEDVTEPGEMGDVERAIKKLEAQGKVQRLQERLEEIAARLETPGYDSFTEAMSTSARRRRTWEERRRIRRAGELAERTCGEILLDEHLAQDAFEAVHERTGSKGKANAELDGAVKATAWHVANQTELLKETGGGVRLLCTTLKRMRDGEQACEVLG